MTLTLRKKLLVTLLIFALAILSWQIYSLFVDTGFKLSSSNLPARPLEQKQQASQLAAVPKLNNNPAPQATSSIQSITSIAAVNANKQVQMVQPSLQLQNNEEQQQVQKNYLHLVSEYQVAQMKRLIAQDYEAIAVANRNAAKAIAQTKALPIKPVVNTQFNDDVLAKQKSKPPHYELVYTGEQSGHWHATIRYGNKLLDINMGSRLANGEKVTEIGQNEVVLAKDNTETHISFYGVRTVAAHVSAVHAIKAEQLHKIPVKPIKTEQRFAERQHINTPKVVKKIAAAKAKTPTKAVAAKKVQRQFSANEKALLHRKHNYYTIELRSSNQLQTVKNYIRRNGLTKKAYYYKRYVNGKPNYVVVYGQYPTAEATLMAIADLPIHLQRWSPMVKANAVVVHEIQHA